MEVLRLTRASEDFYALLGPVFGSRAIEKATKDRFYDDPGKCWYVVPGQAAASVLGHRVRNFWASEEGAADALLARMIEEYEALNGVAPAVYADSFRRMGFRTAPYRKNFIEVWYEKDSVSGDECSDGADQ